MIFRSSPVFAVTYIAAMKILYLPIYEYKDIYIYIEREVYVFMSTKYIYRER